MKGKEKIQKILQVAASNRDQLGRALGKGRDILDDEAVADFLSELASRGVAVIATNALESSGKRRGRKPKAKPVEAPKKRRGRKPKAEPVAEESQDEVEE